jgi:hypothetical protein
MLFKSLIPALQPKRSLGDKDQSILSVQGIIFFSSYPGI